MGETEGDQVQRRAAHLPNTFSPLPSSTLNSLHSSTLSPHEPSTLKPPNAPPSEKAAGARVQVAEIPCPPEKSGRGVGEAECDQVQRRAAHLLIAFSFQVQGLTCNAIVSFFDGHLRGGASMLSATRQNMSCTESTPFAGGTLGGRGVGEAEGDQVQGGAAHLPTAFTFR